MLLAQGVCNIQRTNASYRIKTQFFKKRLKINYGKGAFYFILTLLFPLLSIAQEGAPAQQQGPKIVYINGSYTGDYKNEKRDEQKARRFCVTAPCTAGIGKRG